MNAASDKLAIARETMATRRAYLASIDWQARAQVLAKSIRTLVTLAMHYKAEDKAVRMHAAEMECWKLLTVARRLRNGELLKGHLEVGILGALRAYHSTSARQWHARRSIRADLTRILDTVVFIIDPNGQKSQREKHAYVLHGTRTAKSLYMTNAAILAIRNDARIAQRMAEVISNHADLVASGDLTPEQANEWTNEIADRLVRDGAWS